MRFYCIANKSAIHISPLFWISLRLRSHSAISRVLNSVFPSTVCSIHRINMYQSQPPSSSYPTPSPLVSIPLCSTSVFRFLLWLLTDIELLEFFMYILDINLFIRHIIYKYRLPFSWLPFCFIDSFLLCAEVFSFCRLLVDVLFVYFCFCFLCLRRQIPPTKYY